MENFVKKEKKLDLKHGPLQGQALPLPLLLVLAWLFSFSRGSQHPKAHPPGLAKSGQLCSLAF